MKKSLIALAALAIVSAASAQSTVTLSGNLDFAAGRVTGTQAGANGNTISTASGLTSTTSVLRFIAVEDLGGGLKATVQYNFDPRSLANDSLTNTLNTGSGTPTANTTTGLARDELFVGLSGGFGNLRLGSPNSIGLNSFQVSSPLGTGIGSGYTGGGVAGSLTNSFVQTRYSRSARYDSPSISGFTASVQYAPGNDQAAIGTTNLTALNIPDARKATELGLVYSNGPLNVGYAYVSQAAQTNATGFYSSTTASNFSKTSVSMLNANYALGATTLYAGYNKGDALAGLIGGTSNRTKGYRVAAKQNLGAIDLIASYTTQTATVVSTNADTKATVTGLRADYNLSKTTAAYVGFERYNTGAASANIRNVAAIGMRKSF